MKFFTKKFLVVLSVLLIYVSVFSSTQNVKADTLDSLSALESSIYYSVLDDEVFLNEEEALEKNPNITKYQLESVHHYLSTFSSKKIDTVLEDNGYDPEEVRLDVDSNDGHANWIWVIPVVVGIVVAGGIIFSAYYFSHKEKMTLINKCYQNNGYPEVSSKDKAGLKGTTNSGAAKRAGGYYFTCKKR